MFHVVGALDTVASNRKMGLSYQNQDFFCCLEPYRMRGRGSEEPPPRHINVVPRKMLKEKLLIFFTFPRYGNGVLETTFCIKIKFGLAGAKMVKIGLV